MADSPVAARAGVLGAEEDLAVLADESVQRGQLRGIVRHLGSRCICISEKEAPVLCTINSGV